MIDVRINDESISYDVHSLIKAFYPAEDVRVTADAPDDIDDHTQEKEITTDHDDTDSDSGLSEFLIRITDSEITVCIDKDALKADRSGYKSELKRRLYRALVSQAGRELPWGTLTGIRPTKLAMDRLNAGAGYDDAVSHMKDYYLCSEKKAILAADIASRERKILKQIAAGDGATDPGATDSIRSTLAEGYSLYIGIPFCPSRCLYCSFMSYPIAAHKDAVARYIEALKKETDYVAKAFAGRRLDSIYIGGGTPTTLTAHELEDLIGYVKDKIDLSSIKEFTVEAGRADSIDEDKLKTLLRMGVDRISVNPQTMNEETLKLIGRKATAEETVRAYRLAREVGFDNINMDIILGLPGEDTEDVRRTLDIIADLKPDDLTVHSLAVKRGSKLAEMLNDRKLKAGPSDDTTEDMLRNTAMDYDEAMRMTEETAASTGLYPYYLYRQKNISGNLENTGYAREGRAGIYNILMMEEVQDIVAIGAGTVTKHVYTGDEAGRIERCDTHKDLKLYLENTEEMIERKRRLFTEA